MCNYLFKNTLNTVISIAYEHNTILRIEQIALK